METGTQLGNQRKPPREGQEGVQRRRTIKKLPLWLSGRQSGRRGGSVTSPPDISACRASQLMDRSSCWSVVKEEKKESDFDRIPSEKDVSRISVRFLLINVCVPFFHILCSFLRPCTGCVSVWTGEKLRVGLSGSVRIIRT